MKSKLVGNWIGIEVLAYVFIDVDKVRFVGRELNSLLCLALDPLLRSPSDLKKIGYSYNKISSYRYHKQISHQMHKS